jgi:DNA-binding transcriptional MerR regulator
MMMDNKEMYSIGEVGKLCHISTKALRYYDKIGIISPDYTCEENGYRYYSRKTLLKVPVMKYYKQMRFKLAEMQNLLQGNSCFRVEQHFRKKIEELKDMEREIHDSYLSVEDWYELVREANLVIENDISEISIKFLTPSVYCYMDQEFNNEYMESIINLEWVNYLEEMDMKITGPVILNFPSFQDKMTGTCRKVRIMQKPINSVHVKGKAFCTLEKMVASVYHIGDFRDIHEKYEKMQEWADEKDYICGPECFERYIIDYWTTKNPEEFVTELMVPIMKKPSP